MTNTRRFTAALISALALAIAFTAVPSHAADASPPTVYCLNPVALAATKARIAGGNPGTLKPALDALVASADRALKVGAQSVMDKTMTPPSGDKHDYVSLAPYWWPDPTKKDGLPYIRHDGRHNPDADSPANSDGHRKSLMASSVETLSLAYYLTGREPYAAHAAELLRAWFLDPATRMNPNLNYGQAVLGANDGRGTGIIETVDLTHVVDGAGLLAGSPAWTSADQKGLAEWMASYLTWLQTSKNGIEEAKATNNHGTWYDVQIASLALFTGQPELAKHTLEAAKTKRLARQIEPDGRQPLELARTNSLGYSTFNLSALETLANLGDRVGVDLWGFETADGRGIRKAVDFLAPYVADPSKPWPTQQIVKENRAALIPLLADANRHYRDPALAAALAAAKGGNPGDRYHLLVSTAP